MPELTKDDAIKVSLSHMEPDVLMAMLADAVDPNVTRAMQVQRMWDRLKIMDLASRHGMAHCVCTMTAMQTFVSEGGRIIFVDRPTIPAGEDGSKAE